HGTRHISVLAKALLKIHREGALAMIVADPSNKWDSNTFDIYMFRPGADSIRVGCVQRNLAQLLTRLGVKKLAGRLVVSQDSHGMSVFEVEVLGEFFSDEPDNAQAVEQEDY